MTDIDERTFTGCCGLKSITVHPDNPVYTSENGILFNKDKTELKRCPEGQKGDYIIPASVVKIGVFAFFFCYGLTAIKVHPDNPVFSSENGILFNKDKTKLIVYPPAQRQSEYFVPDSVTKIEERAFCECSNLTSIFIPISVTEVGYRAFFGCSGLTSMTIPASVTEIGEQIFFRCTSLTDIIIHPDNPVFASENGILLNKDKTILIRYPEGRQGNYVISDSVVRIKNRAFEDCTGLISVVIPDSVTVIEESAFDCLDGLTSVIISNSVTEIGFRAFGDCTGLTSVVLPASVTKIGCNAFSNCRAFFTVHPDNPVYKSVNGKLKRKRKKNSITEEISNMSFYDFQNWLIKRSKKYWENLEKK